MFTFIFGLFNAAVEVIKTLIQDFCFGFVADCINMSL